MFKRVEIFYLLKRVRGFAPDSWTNVRQRVSFAEGEF